MKGSTIMRVGRLGGGILTLAASWGLLHADAIVVTRAMTATTIAEIFIDEEAVTVELEIGLPDLEAFRNLMPDSLYERMGYEPEPLAKRLARFYRQDLVLRAGDGPPLVPRVDEISGRPRVRRDAITGEPLAVEVGDDELVVFARFVYPLPRRPASLSITPPQSEGGGATATIGFVTYHHGLPVNDFRYLGTTETLELDWGDPWYSRFDNRNLRRQFDAPMSVFLYIEPYEVRKEIVVRPRDLQQWTDLGLEGREIIPAEEQAEIKRRAGEFLLQGAPVMVDGKKAEGELDRIHFIRRTLRRTGIIEPPEDLDLISATLGVIFVYPIGGLPDEVTVEWDLFSDRIQRVPCAATDEAGGLPSFLTPEYPQLTWQNFLTNPTVPTLVEVQTPSRGLGWVFIALASVGGLGLVVVGFRLGRGFLRGPRPSWKAWSATVVLLGVVAFAAPRAVTASTVSSDEARAIVSGLLENVYRAFDYRDESAIYDTLEKSVAGDLLTEIYLETRRSLEIENQGGARAKVKQIEMLDSTHDSSSGDFGFESRSTWKVSGSVGHWGHLHLRTNQYKARITVKALDGAWKITDLELLEEQRL